MSQTVTFDDVWKMFQETDRKFQEMVREDRERRLELGRKIQETDQQIKEISAQMRETDRKFQDTDRKFQDTDRKFQDTDRKFQETDRKFQDTDREIRGTWQQIKEVSIQMQDTDRKIKEVSAQMQDTDRKIKEVSAQIGRLGGRLGEFVESLVAPACETLFAERGIPVHRVSRQVKARLDGGRHMEIDLLVVNTGTVLLIEVKSKLTVEDVQDHEKQMGEFKEFFPEHADKKAVGAVAGMVVDESVIRFAIKRGLFVLVQAGDLVRIANDEAFAPRAW